MWERIGVSAYVSSVVRAVPCGVSTPPRGRVPQVALRQKSLPFPSEKALRVPHHAAPTHAAEFRGWYLQRSFEAKLRTLKGMLLLRQGQYREAIREFDAGLVLDPKNAAAYGGRAFAKKELGLLPEAIADFTRLLSLDAANGVAWHQRGMSHCMMEQYTRCIRDLERSVQSGEKPDASYHQPLGIAHIKLGHFAQAHHHIKKTFALIDDAASRSNHKVLHRVPELNFAVQGRVRPASPTRYDVYTGLGATWYLTPIARSLSLGAKLSAGYGAHPEAHTFELAAGPVLMSEFMHGKLGLGIEAGYAFLLGGDPRAALHSKTSIVRYGVHYDHRVWRRLWMGGAVQAQHDGDNPKNYSLGAGVRLMVNLW